MTRLLDLLLATAFAAIVGGTWVSAFNLAKNPPVPRPELGLRGLKRARALQRGGPFATVEPLIRFVASWFRPLPVEKLRVPIGRALVHAGEHLGLSADELLAMSVMSGVGLSSVGLVLREFAHYSIAIVVCGFVLGTAMPLFRVLGIARERARRVTRALPGAVDLASLCMSAGLDFPGALRRIVDSAADSTDPVVEEFARILQELELGYTRRRALESFAQRVPTEQVREFVNSVVQAENRGNPLSEVLTIQAQTQRLRRSIAAEESASGAALMLMGPMILIFVCVIVLLLGPVVVRFMTGGFGTP